MWLWATSLRRQLPAAGRVGLAVPRVGEQRAEIGRRILLPARYDPEPAARQGFPRQTIS